MPVQPPPSAPGRTRVIQGSFRGGRPRLAIQAHSAPGARTAGMPPGARSGAPRSAPVAQPFRDSTVFQVPSSVNFAAGGTGQPLPQAVLQKMESFFGASFADVRVHVGPQAASIGALAFTMGSDLYFAPGQYSPHSAQGQRLLGHELTHVVQQRAGRVRNPLGSGVAVVQDPALEAEAERMGMRVGTMPTQSALQPRMRGSAPGPVKQRGRYSIQRLAGAGEGRSLIRAVVPGALDVVGSVRVRPTRSDWLEVTDLKVAQPHRRRGVATLLMREAVQMAQHTGLKGAVLEARPSDGSISPQALTAMYQGLGFQTVALSRRGFPQMTLSLRSAAEQSPPPTRRSSTGGVALRKSRRLIQRAEASGSGNDGWDDQPWRKYEKKKGEKSEVQIDEDAGSFKVLQQFQQRNRANKRYDQVGIGSELWEKLKELVNNYNVVIRGVDVVNKHALENATMRKIELALWGLADYLAGRIHDDPNDREMINLARCGFIQAVINCITDSCNNELAKGLLGSLDQIKKG